MTDSVEVAIVGGGPAGAITAALLARAGRGVLLLERAPRWRWRACGVFASPATVTALRRVGLAASDLARVARPIPAMRVETQRGTRFGLSYGGNGDPATSPVGFDRSELDPLLLAMAGTAGADVREGASVATVQLPDGSFGGAETGSRAVLSLASRARVEARVVVGADGLRSLVASAAGVSRPAPLGRRTGLTFHIPDQAASADGRAGEPSDARMDARMVVIDDGYVGLAPVPGGRLNVGIVLGASWDSRLHRDGARQVAQPILRRVLPRGAMAGEFPVLDHVAGASPLGSAVLRRAGDGWLLVGDAAGFLDPFTGEGLHRAIVSAELAAEVIDRALAAPGRADLADHERAMRARFRPKDVVSRIVQTFLGRPAMFEYAARRLAARPQLRETMGLVIGDLLPATRALDPRYLAALLAP